MDVTRTFDLLGYGKEKYPRADVLAAKYNGAWKKFSTDEFIETVNHFSYGLLAMGVSKGDKIATIFSNNLPEWNFTDMGLAQIGAVHVPVYPTLSDYDHSLILAHSDAKYIIVSDKTIYDKIQPLTEDISAIKDIYCVERSNGIPCWEDIVNLGKNNAEKYAGELVQVKKSINPDDLLTIIYTSGTTGTPKGVMLSHRNILSNSIATAPIQPMDYGDKALSFLPLCHVYERMMSYHALYKGISMYYAENLTTVIDNIRELKPNGFNTVPRLLEKVYLAIISKGKDLGGIRKKIFFWALNLGTRYEIKNRSVFYNFQLWIADKLVFNKWRAAIGGNVKVIVSGGSSLQSRLSKVFWAAGIPVLEGYGLTETSPVIAVSHYHPERFKFGTVGPVLEGVLVKIGDDGEILCKSPGLMLGYYKDEKYTRGVIDEDGWFHTGDIGELDDNKFLKITDRKKEIFKLSGGKYIAPQVIENKFKASSFVEQIMVVGENEKFTGAVISPNFVYLHFWALKHKVHFRDNMELIKNPLVIARVQKEIDTINATLGQVEQIKQFRLVTEEWSQATGELSPTLKLKRKILLTKYCKLLEGMYRG